MEKNNFKKIFFLQTACLVSIYAIIIFSLYQQSFPTLADQESVLNSGFHETVSDDVNHKNKKMNRNDAGSLNLQTLEKKLKPERCESTSSRIDWDTRFSPTGGSTELY